MSHAFLEGYIRDCPLPPREIPLSCPSHLILVGPMLLSSHLICKNFKASLSKHCFHLILA